MVFPHMFRSEHTETVTTSSAYGAFYEWAKVPHVPIDPEVVELLKYVDDTTKIYISDLKDAIAIPSISGSFDHRHDVTKMIDFTEVWLKKLNVKYERFDVGWQRLNGVCVKLPEVILGQLRTPKCKKTLCIYAHLDVIDPKNEKWDTDPWELTEKDKQLFGKGVASGKGLLISWFHAIQAYQKHKMALPINIKFVIEAMHEQNSQGLEDLLKSKKIKFFSNVDCVVICDSEWLGPKYPCIVYGAAGTCRFELTVEKHNDSNHNNDMDLVCSTICNPNGQVTIPDFYKLVDEITPAEENLYDTIHYDFEEIRPTLSEDKQRWDKVQLLMSFWRLPDITFGPIEICNCDKNDGNILKRKFTIKIVPKQVPELIAELVNSHVYNICQQLQCQSKVSIEMIYGARPWLVDFRDPNYQAARKATVQIYKEEPNMIREDKELPILLMLNRVIEKNVVLLPIVNSTSNARLENENISRRNFFEGTKLMIAYLFQLPANL